MRHCDGIVTVFDLTKRDTFEWVREMILVARGSYDESLPIMIIGNKLELCEDSKDENKRQIQTEEIQEFALANNSQYLELNQLTNYDIKDAFHNLTEKSLIIKLAKIKEQEERSEENRPSFKISYETERASASR